MVPGSRFGSGFFRNRRALLGVHVNIIFQNLNADVSMKDCQSKYFRNFYWIITCFDRSKINKEAAKNPPKSVSPLLFPEALVPQYSNTPHNTPNARSSAVTPL